MTRKQRQFIKHNLADKKPRPDRNVWKGRHGGRLEKHLEFALRSTPTSSY